MFSKRKKTTTKHVHLITMTVDILQATPIAFDSITLGKEEKESSAPHSQRQRPHGITLPLT